MEILLKDCQFALRRLLKTPGFTAVAVLILALGIGANTAIFIVLQAALLRPIPWRQPERLVYVWESQLEKGIDRQIVSLSNYLDWKETSAVFEQSAAWRFLYLNCTGQGEPERVQGLTMSAGFFATLGVNAALGRTFSPEEDQPGRERVVILSHNFWRRRFAGDAAIAGKKITLDGLPFSAVPRVGQFALNGGVFGFAFLVSALSGAAIGLAPVLETFKLQLVDTLKESANRSLSSSLGMSRLRQGLVVAEAVLSTMLLIGAGLLIRSASYLLSSPRGLDPKGVLTAQIWLPEEQYPDGRKAAQFFDRALERMKALPGVESAGAAWRLT